MSLSVNNNPGALIALQNLTSTESQLQKAQNQISTGLAIASPSDNGAIWAIAQNQRATASSLDSVTQSLQRAQSTIDVATSAGQSVSDLLTQLKSKALAASDSSLDTASRAALNADFTSLRNQITTVVSNASFNGANLIDSGSKNIYALANSAGTSSLTVAAQDLSLGGSNVALTATTSISTATLAQNAIAVIETSITNVNNALAKLGTAENALTYAADLRVEPAGHHRHRRRQPGQRQPGQGKRPAPGPADQAAARHPGALYRQFLELLATEPLSLNQNWCALPRERANFPKGGRPRVARPFFWGEPGAAVEWAATSALALELDNRIWDAASKTFPACRRRNHPAPQAWEDGDTQAATPVSQDPFRPGVKSRVRHPARTPIRPPLRGGPLLPP